MLKNPRELSQPTTRASGTTKARKIWIRTSRSGAGAEGFVGGIAGAVRRSIIRSQWHAARDPITLPAGCFPAMQPSGQSQIAGIDAEAQPLAGQHQLQARSAVDQGPPQLCILLGTLHQTFQFTPAHRIRCGGIRVATLRPEDNTQACPSPGKPLQCLTSMVRTPPEPPRLRPPSLLRHPLGSLLILCLLAITTNQVGIDLFYGVRLYLGSAVVVLALLLLGSQGLLVGLASVLLVPRLWQEPQAATLMLAEALWLTLYLRSGDHPIARRERGGVVMADILFWIVVAMPLDFLLFGVIANVDLPRVLDLSLLQAINGSINAALAYGLFVVIRVVQARRSRNRLVSLQGITLISVLGCTLTASLLTIGLSVRQYDRNLVDNQVLRFRQVAMTTVALERSALDDLAVLRRQQDSPLDFRVLDGRGRLLYDSNPALFRSLDVRYQETQAALSQQPQVAEPLDLMVPVESLDAALSGLTGYWRYETKDDLFSQQGRSLIPSQDRLVVLVEPAADGIRELQSQSSRAIRLLGLIVLLAALVSRSIARLVVRQVPHPQALPADGGDPEAAAAADPPRDPRASPGGSRQRFILLELQPLLDAFQTRGAGLAQLRDALRRSERQRHRLEAEVGRLNNLDPLTGCFNRRELYRRLDHELRQGGGDQHDLCLLSLEVDHLRQITDSYGNLVSDEILRRVAMELRHRSRATDLLCRLGPDQFALLLPACELEAAERIAALLREAVRSLEIRHEGLILAVTLSIGVVAYQPQRDDPDSLITRAQSALYRAKAEGRNRVVTA